MRIRPSMKYVPGAIEAMGALSQAVHDSALGQSDPLLMELVKLRVSQINECGYCLDMHSKDALALGETPQRIVVLPGWREAPFYSERERAALAFAEELTRLSNEVECDEALAGARDVFSDEEIAALTWEIVVMNGWNRATKVFGYSVGSYVSPYAEA